MKKVICEYVNKARVGCRVGYSLNLNADLIKVSYSLCTNFVNGNHNWT